MGELIRRVQRWLRWQRLDDELSEEMAFHRAMAERQFEAAGMTPEAAAAAARRTFGSDALTADRARDVWVAAWAQDLARDVRFAFRMLARERAFTAVTVLVLGLGIGTASLQSVLVDAVCIRGLPIPGVDRVLFLGARDAHNHDLALSYREFDRIRAATPGVGDVSAFASAPAALGDDDRAPDRALVTYLSSTTFRMLREPAQLGRDFEAADDRPGAPPVAILAAGMWRSRYAADPAVIGRSVRVNGTPTTIVGVMREPFRFPSVTDVWLPLSSMPGITTERRAARALSVAARLDDAATLAGVRGVLAGEADRLAREYPDTNAGIALRAVPINERYNGRLTDAVWIAFVLVGVIVLLIACANAANMLLLRASARTHEMAVRASLGASRWRIVRQLLVESAVLALLGGALGAVLAAASLAGINAIIPENTLAYWMRFRLDVRGFAVLCAVCLGTVMVFGLAPALHVASTDVNAAIKSGGRGGFAAVRGRRWTAICLAAECGLTMVMLAGLIVGVRTALDEGKKFVAVQPAGVLTTWLTLPADRYRTVEARRAFYRALEARVSALPGTSAVAIATALPLGGAAPRTLVIDGEPPRPERTPPTVWTVAVSRRYFDAVGVATTRGRAFGDRDGLPGYETAIVNQRFADMFFIGRDAIGGHLRLTEPNLPAANAPPLTIVGVVPSIRQLTTSAGPDPLVYLPLAAAPPVSAVLFVRGAPDAAPAAAPLREALHDLDPELPLYRTMPMARALDASQWNGRVSEWLLYSITVVAVALASLGLYAVIAHAISHRTREIGIRVALGATRRRVVSLVARQAAVHFALGVGAGIACVFGFARLTAGDGAGPTAGYQITSASTLAAVAALLAAITAVASIAPAWRACRVDPAQTLRES
jgi:putative ABC transport system permease protein